MQGILIGFTVVALTAADPPAVPPAASKAKAAPADDKTASEAADRERDTLASVQEMLRDVWMAPANKAKKLGNAVLQRARRQDASVPDVQYAYGVALVRLGDLSAAETNFRAILEKDKTQARVRLGVIQLHYMAERWSSAIEELDRLRENDPDDPQVVVALARAITFFSDRPPTKFRPRELKELETLVRASLSPATQKIYDEACADTKDYIGRIPQMREELLQPVVTLQEESLELQKEAEKLDKAILPLRTDLERTALDIERTQASGNADLADIDRQIARAQQRGDSTDVSSYQIQRQAILERIEARVRSIRLRQQEFEVRLNRELAAQQNLLVQAQAKSQQAEQASAEVDRFLSRPPASWTPIEERERLLAGEILEIVRKPKREPSSPAGALSLSGDAAKEPAKDAAKVWLSLADTSRLSGKNELARKYYEKVISEFPKSLAAEDAAWQLDQMKEVEQPTPTAPPKKRSRKEKSSAKDPKSDEP
jgi:tetratricopeptide (TPR) repeat protein